MNPIDRIDYHSEGLRESELDPHPLAQFTHWLDDAAAAGIAEPNAMSLATVTADGQPHVRTVLCKHADPAGFVFFTNYHSDKGRQIAENPRVALGFHWQPLFRQVRVTGIAQPLDAVESDEYYNSRPLEARLGAWASAQSQVIHDREFLQRQLDEVRERFGEAVKRPPNWGGYNVTVSTIEFWQGQPSRLHDRLRFSRRGEALLDDPSGWDVVRLSP